MCAIIKVVFVLVMLIEYLMIDIVGARLENRDSDEKRENLVFTVCFCWHVVFVGTYVDVDVKVVFYWRHTLLNTRVCWRIGKSR